MQNLDQKKKPVEKLSQSTSDKKDKSMLSRALRDNLIRRKKAKIKQDGKHVL